MSIDITKLTPAPWTPVAVCYEHCQFPHAWIVGGGEFSDREDAELYCLMRNALDVMTRRGWGTMEYFIPQKDMTFKRVFKVFGNGLDSAELWNMPRIHDNPLMALVAADGWYKENID